MVGENFVSIKRLNVGPAPDMFKGLPGVEMLVPIANPVRAYKQPNRCVQRNSPPQKITHAHTRFCRRFTGALRTLTTPPRATRRIEISGP